MFEPNGWDNSKIEGEESLHLQDNVRLDDGDQKVKKINHFDITNFVQKCFIYCENSYLLQTNFTSGTVVITTHRLIWRNKSIIQSDLVLSLHYVIFVEEEGGGGFTRSDKIVLHLAAPPPSKIFYTIILVTLVI